MEKNYYFVHRSPSTKRPLAKCELANQRLAGFLHELESDRSLHARTQPRLDTCDDLAVRPLAWDLAAAPCRGTAARRSTR